MNCCDFEKLQVSAFLFENQHKSVKSYLSDINGHLKRDFHEETIAIESGEIDFRSTVTHFKFCFSSDFYHFFVQSHVFLSGIVTW